MPFCADRAQQNAEGDIHTEGGRMSLIRQGGRLFFERTENHFRRIGLAAEYEQLCMSRADFHRAWIGWALMGAAPVDRETDERIGTVEVPGPLTDDTEGFEQVDLRAGIIGEGTRLTDAIGDQGRDPDAVDRSALSATPLKEIFEEARR
ncbi:MAG: hypothetical protein U5K74_13045 [Gemmatimonadaceae bacterium]|nr:hypothetical protein [Gemmatimonadaceae bacterium]